MEEDNVENSEDTFTVEHRHLRHADRAHLSSDQVSLAATSPVSSAAGSVSSSSSAVEQLQRLLIKLLTRRAPIKNSLEAHAESWDEEQQLATNMISSLMSDKNETKNLSFEWVISKWSPCSITCGIGFQVSHAIPIWSEGLSVVYNYGHLCPCNHKQCFASFLTNYET